MMDAVDLSVIVTVTAGVGAVRRCLTSLIPQAQGRRVEILIPHTEGSSLPAALQGEFPAVRFIDMGRPQTTAPAHTPAGQHEIYDLIKACGLREARGALVALLDDSGAPADDWVEQTLLAHQLPHAAIGGAVEHSGKGRWNWAAYFQDFGRFGLPLCEGPAEYLTDINIAYKRAALEAVRPLWQERYHEVTVNWALSRMGCVLWRRPQMVVHLDRGRLSAGGQVGERLSWGRLFGRLRGRELPGFARLLHFLAAPLLPFLLFSRIVQKAISSKRHRLALLNSLPQLMITLSAWSLGEAVGTLKE